MESDLRADQLVELEDEEEFDDNGLPSCDPSAQVPVGSVEDRSSSHLKDCDEGVVDIESEYDEEEDDNGVVRSPMPSEDNSNATETESSSKDKHKDSGGTALQDFSEQDDISKQGESALTSYGDGTSESFVAVVKRDAAEEENALQGNVTNLTLADRGEESSRRSLAQKTPDDADCLAQTTSNIDEGLADSNDDATERIEEQTDKDTRDYCFNKTAGVLPTTTESGRGKLAALPDGETHELDTGTGRESSKASVESISQAGSGRKTAGQPGDGSSYRPIDGRENSEKNDNHSANVRKLSSIQTSFNFMFILSVFSGLTFSLGVKGALTVKPGDVLALSGSVARLRCSTDYSSPVYWQRMLFGSDEQETIYYGKNGMARSVGDRFSVEEDSTSGRYDLVISNVQMEDAGTYVCIDEAGIGEGFRGELVVSERFTCEMPVPRNGFMGENIFDIPEDPVESTCSLVFRGNVVPRFQWTWDSGAPLVTQTVINGSTVTSSVRLRATHDLNGARLICLPIVSAAGASSVDDSMRWTSESVSVRHVHLIFGSVAECQSSSAMIPVCNPNCTYEVHQTSDCKFQCLAVYNEQGTTYNKIFNEYSCENSAWPSNAVIIVVAIVSAFAIAAAAGAVIVLIKFKWSRKKKDSNSVEEPLNQKKNEN